MKITPLEIRQKQFERVLRGWEAERQARIKRDIEKHKVMSQALYDDGKDLEDYNSFAELTEAYEELLARRAANREESGEIVQNRGESNPSLGAPAPLPASFEAADQLKAYPEALKRAAAISAKVYNEQNGEYWLKYYQGTREQDKTGNMVELGGSAVNNLNDNLLLFGLQPGANNNFRSTYTVFGNIATQQYPALFKDANKIPDVKEILDTSYVLGASSMLSQTGAEADVASFSSSGDTGTVVSKRDWSIEFDTGKASFTSDGERKMYEIKEDLAIAAALFVTLNGHTDNTGTREGNMDLAERRAQAVRDWLQRKAPANFPDSRFRIHAYGDSKPLASNATAEGRAKNRRVEIILSGKE